jgi:twinkle protein
MGQASRYRQPCLDPTCGSSDARTIYEDGTSHCFSCDTGFSKLETAEEEVIDRPTAKDIKVGKKAKNINLDLLKSTAIKARGISQEIVEFYGVKMTFDSLGDVESHLYPYPSGVKVRTLPKDFWSQGKTRGLFGQDKFNFNGKRVIICEGEIDTLSVAEASFKKYKKMYPIIGVPSSTNLKGLLAAREILRQCDEVVICFDNDKAGEDAAILAAKIVGIDKAKITKLTRNDANETLVEDGAFALLEAVWNSQKHIPAGILSKDEIWERLEEYNKIESVLYPDCLRGINTKTKGMRGGEISLFISGTGAGKSSMLREIMYHLLSTTEASIGIVSLEESPAETARKLAGVALNRNPAAEEEPIPLEELKIGFDEIFEKNRVFLLDHQGSIKDDSIIDRLEFMALSGCKYIFIDHITILVSEGAENLQGLEAQDYIMNQLLSIVKKYPDVWIGLVSHLRKTPAGGKSFEQGRLPSLDDIKGSGSIKQISFDIIAFARDMETDDSLIRNTIDMSVLKCRYTGLTGPTDGARYDFKTGRLRHYTEGDFEVIEEGFVGTETGEIITSLS